MMLSYLTPGVYTERADAVLPPIMALRTDVASFVGIAERGPLDLATPVQSWRQFQARFGSFIPSGYLAYVVKGFFENGGRKCYVVRVANRDAAANSGVTLLDSNPVPQNRKPAWRIEAATPGGWGNQLAVLLRVTHRAQTRTRIDPDRDDRTVSRVASVANFERGTLARLFQRGAATVERLGVVKAVAGESQRLVWRDPLDAQFVPGLPILIESIEYTLAVYFQGRLVALYEGLSIVPEHPRYVRTVASISASVPDEPQDNALPPPPAWISVRSETEISGDFFIPATVDELAAEMPSPRLLQGGRDGLETLSLRDFVGENDDLSAGADERRARRRGIRAFERIDEISLVAVPDIHIQPARQVLRAPLPSPEPDVCRFGPAESPPPAAPPVFAEQPPRFSDEDVFRVQSALVSHCEERRDRFAILDAPFSAAGRSQLGSGPVLAWRSRFDSKYAGLYFSWLRVVDPLRLGGGVVREVPPCGHVAGLYAQTDRRIGVHRAPANVLLDWAQDVTVPVDDAVQAGLNPRGVNVLRSFPGRGLRIYGARTVSSDPDWRYVNVRRLLILIEEAIDVATQWAVFEPNDSDTRSKVRLSIASFLEALWRGGALAGGQIDEAFYVKCDEENNPSEERTKGRLLVEVGVAPSIPAEFIVLRLGRTGEELEIIEE